jgi:hypothetical protein
MHQKEYFSTLRSAYAGYFDDISPSSMTAVPLGAVTTTVPQEQHTEETPHAEVVHDAECSRHLKVHREPGVYYTSTTGARDSDQQYIQLTQFQFALLCMGAGVAVGLIISQRLRV